MKLLLPEYLGTASCSDMSFFLFIVSSPADLGRTSGVILCAFLGEFHKLSSACGRALRAARVSAASVSCCRGEDRVPPGSPRWLFSIRNSASVVSLVFPSGVLMAKGNDSRRRAPWRGLTRQLGPLQGTAMGLPGHCWSRYVASKALCGHRSCRHLISPVAAEIGVL